MNERFKILRNQLKKNQTDFSIDLHTNQQGISDIERGIKQIPFEIIEILGNKFNVNLNWLILNKGEMFVNNNYDLVQEPKPNYEKKNSSNNEIESIKKRLTNIEYKLKIPK